LIRIDIPDQRHPDYDRLHGRHGEITRILEVDADDVTGDLRDATLFRVELDDGTTTDLRWRDLRPP